MGDFRAEIHITFKIQGKTFHGDWDWINYSPNSEGMDRRIADWFQECWEKAYAIHQNRLQKYFEERNKIEIEKEERRMLEILKEKYENTNQLIKKE